MLWAAASGGDCEVWDIAGNLFCLIQEADFCQDKAEDGNDAAEPEKGGTNGREKENPADCANASSRWV